MRTYESKKRANTGSEVLLDVSHGGRNDLVRYVQQSVTMEA